jgi:hypothetical protein
MISLDVYASKKNSYPFQNAKDILGMVEIQGKCSKVSREKGSIKGVSAYAFLPRCFFSRERTRGAHYMPSPIYLRAGLPIGTHPVLFI